MGPYGPIWAHMGPARALEEREKLKKSEPFFQVTFFLEIFVFDLQSTFVDGKTVFFKFLAEIRLRTPIKSLQKPRSRPQSCNFHTPLQPALSYSLIQTVT